VGGHRELQKEATRRRILTTALALFSERGYATTTIDDIARAASTTRVTFYAYFDSRRDLMLALIGELDVLVDRGPDRDPASSGLVEAVRIGTIESLGPWLRDQAARWPTIKPYMIAAAEASAIDSEIRELYVAWFDEIISEIETGLTLADRFAPESRRYRGELAIAQLDHLARHWMREPWDIDESPAIGVLIESWTKLLG